MRCDAYALYGLFAMPPSMPDAILFLLSGCHHAKSSDAYDDVVPVTFRAWKKTRKDTKTRGTACRGGCLDREMSGPDLVLAYHLDSSKNDVTTGGANATLIRIAPRLDLKYPGERRKMTSGTYDGECLLSLIQCSVRHHRPSRRKLMMGKQTGQR